MNQSTAIQPQVSLAQSSPTVGTFRERDGALEWSGRTETVRIEPWGPDAVRVRARLGGPLLEGLPGALLDAPEDTASTLELAGGEGRLTVGAVEFWDVAQGRRRLEPGPYELLVGASSEDVRLSATLELDGEPGVFRPMRERGLEAADFDEQRGTAIVDRTRTTGDAVTPSDGDAGELLYLGCDFGAGVTGVAVEVAGEGVVEVSLDGELGAELRVSGTGGVYDYRTLTGAFTAEGVHDVRIGLRGRVRLAHVGFSG
ncbi:carbohydrate-binding protein [Streptomyces sp. NPDC001914]|uniref:carbohydrate-binding protein n=1 Tax=Streptomyces sp. NPDC001914 TaxID=3364623 RepID=UPI0036932C69